MIDPARLNAACERVRDQLLGERTAAGHWVGELSTSALSTATAVSALALVQRHSPPHAGSTALIARGVAWLAGHQNPDGGWGDTDRSYSNIATTMLVRAAFHLAGAARKLCRRRWPPASLHRRQGRLGRPAARYGRDKTFAVPILTNCALAGLVPWSDVPPLPFELACVPQRFYRFVRLAGRQLCHPGAGGDRAGPLPPLAVRLAVDAAGCGGRRSSPACACCSGCSRTAAVSWKPRR